VGFADEGDAAKEGFCRFRGGGDLSDVAEAVAALDRMSEIGRVVRGVVLRSPGVRIGSLNHFRIIRLRLLCVP
jgi:hypothetical protein